ncbi:MAG: OmpH family outer membrane protein, partial [Bacteroidota bacterium]
NIMRTSTILFSLVCIALSYSTSAFAQTTTDEGKIGFVNPQAILARMPEMKAVQQRLQNFAERKQQELLTKEQQFQQEVATYQQKAAVISDDAKLKEEERLGQLQVELQTAQQQAEAELEQKRGELLGPLLGQIGDAINEVAKEMNLGYVLNTTTSTGDLIILYASESYQQKYDITEPVMQKLGMFN